MKIGNRRASYLLALIGFAQGASAQADQIELNCNMLYQCDDTQRCFARMTKVSFQTQNMIQNSDEIVGEFKWQHMFEGEGMLKTSTWDDFEMYRISHWTAEGEWINLIVGQDGIGVLSHRNLNSDPSFHQLFYGRCEVDK